MGSSVSQSISKGDGIAGEDSRPSRVNSGVRVWSGPDPRADHTRAKQRIFKACREQGPCRAKPVFYLFNMDARDAQDNHYGRMLHERLTPAMIACGFAEVQDCKVAVSRKKSCASCPSMSIKPLPMLDFEPVSNHQAQEFVK